MQPLTTFISIVALASNVLAGGPWAKETAVATSWRAQESRANSRPRCLTNATASAIVTGYTYLLEKPTGPDFNSIAEALLTEDFVVWSDSIQFLGSKPLNNPSFTSRANFIAAQAKTPAIPTVTTDEIFHTCEKILWHWTGSGMRPMASKGIITMDIENGLIAAVYSEFNTGAGKAGRLPSTRKSSRLEPGGVQGTERIFFDGKYKTQIFGQAQN